MKTTPLLLKLKNLFTIIGCMIVIPLSAQETCVDTCFVPWIPPTYDVSETHWDEPTSFWQNGGHIPENTVDEDTTNYARAHIKASGSATLRITDEDTVYASGQFVGYLVKSRAFRDTVFDGVTISTYLNGELQESKTGDELCIEYVPFYVNDPIHLGFETTLAWNAIEIHMSRENGGPRVHYDVFYAVLEGVCLPGNEELPPPLPVTWVSFEAQKKGEASDLRWTTAQEFNNAGFKVERSTDGRLFQTIGSVDASVTSRELNTYTFIDQTPARGMNYYRIKQTDVDGKVNYSPVRSLSFNTTGFYVRSWPNPVTESLYIELPADATVEGEIQLVNSTGIVVMSEKFGNAVQQTTLDMSRIDGGIYSLVVRSGENRIVEKIVVLK